MKLSLKQLRKIIKEEFVLSNAIPDFVLTQALDKTNEALRVAILRYIQQTLATSPEKRYLAERKMNEFLEAFKKDVREDFEARLADFLNEF